nr:MAG TPA: hypothetical protein [Caudoviricetes sp.]
MFFFNFSDKLSSIELLNFNLTNWRYLGYY